MTFLARNLRTRRPPPLVAPQVPRTSAGMLLSMAMPLTYDAAHASQKTIFEESFRRVSPDNDMDQEFDLQGHSTARWGQHSWRHRGSETRWHEMIP